MNRLRKKCFIASSSLHLVLLVILVVSPAFRTKEDKKITPVVHVLDGALVAKVLSAAAAAQPPQPGPPPPAAPTPKPVVREETPKPPVKQAEPKPEPKSEPKPEPKPERKPVVKPTPKPVVKKTPPKPKEITKPTPKPTRESPPKIKIASLDNLITASDSSAEKKRREAEERRQREAAKRAELEQKRQLAKLDSLLGDVKFSKGVNVRTSGSSTRATMDYASYVVQTYDREWREPVQMAGSRYTAEVTVTIRSNGSVASVRISRRSGVGALDNSIQEVIDRVRRFRPFPAGMDDSQQTFTIDFSVRAK